MTINQKQVILHLGFPKTGSTSIQLTMLKNSELLLSKGFYYPDFKVNDIPITNHSIPLYSLYMDNVDGHVAFVNYQWDPKKVIPIFRDHFANYLLTENNLVISSEDTLWFSEDSLKEMKSQFESHGFKIRPIAFVRESISDFTSRIQGDLHWTNSTSIEKFIQGYADYALPHIKKLKNIFNNIEFYSFEEVTKFSGGPVNFFLHLLNLSSSEFEIHEANKSLSSPAIRICNYLCQKTPLYLNNTINFTRKFRDLWWTHKIKGPKFSFLKNEIAPIYDKLCQSRYMLEEVTEIKFKTPITPLENFPDTFTWSNESIDSLLEVLPSIREGMLCRIYDYFFELHQLRQLNYNNLTKIGQSMRQLM